MNFVTTPSCVAQNSSFEFWPETDIWYRLNSAWRFSVFVPTTKYNESVNRDLNVYIQADYSWGKTKNVIFRRLVDQEREQVMRTWMIRGGIMEGWSLDNNSSGYQEEMVYAEIHKKSPLNNHFLLSHRFRTDTRWLGEDNNFSYRFRYRIMLEKDFKSGNYSLVPFTSIETYWESRYSKVRRTRVVGGVTASKGSKYALEGNVTYQYDETSIEQNMYALNIILHFYFESKQNKPKVSN